MNSSTTVFPHLAEQLVRAGNRRAMSAARVRRRTKICVAAGAAALALTAIATATDIWRPQLGDDHRGHPAVGSTAPPASQLDRFGVLRRAQTDVDRSAVAAYALKFLDPSFDGVRTSFVRVLDKGTNGFGTVLIPVQRYHGKHDALCLFDEDAAGGGVSCFTTDEILSGGAPLIAVTPPPRWVPSAQHPLGELPARYMGLVPDGVARVQITVAGRTSTAAVHHNFYAIRRPGITGTAQAAPSAGMHVRWLTADGAVVLDRVL